jgi:hypothetical protein
VEWFNRIERRWVKVLLSGLSAGVIAAAGAFITAMNEGGWPPSATSWATIAAFGVAALFKDIKTYVATP